MAGESGQDTGGLCLTRKPGEVILIGDNIRIEIAEIVKGHKVRVRIRAPREVRIMREEILDREPRK